jgi:hypothetical protein
VNEDRRGAASFGPFTGVGQPVWEAGMIKSYRIARAVNPTEHRMGTSANSVAVAWQAHNCHGPRAGLIETDQSMRLRITSLSVVGNPAAVSINRAASRSPLLAGARGCVSSPASLETAFGVKYQARSIWRGSESACVPPDVQSWTTSKNN